MDNSQDELGIDNENNRTIFLRESDPFLPVIPSPEIEEEPSEHSTAMPTLGIVQCMLEKICVSGVSEYKLKSDCLCESVFKCYSEVIICVIYV